MKEMQWSDAHTDALTDFDHYFNTRYQKAEVVPYTPPPAQLPVQVTKPALDSFTATIVRIAPPVVALTAVASIVGVVVATATAVVGAAFAFVSEHAMLIGGGALAVCVAVGALAGRSSISSNGSDGRNGSAGVAAQNINVTVNVSGQTVSTNGSK